MADTTAKDALGIATDMEYLKLYFTSLVGLWLLFKTKPLLPDIEESVQGVPLLDGILGFLLTLIGFYLVFSSVVGIAYKFKTS